MIYIEKIILLLAAIFAIAAIHSPKTKRAVIYMGTFSFFASLLYLFYQSPNVAIAEAAMGCTLAIVIYLVALKKQKKFLVYVYYDISHDLLEIIENFCQSEDLIFHYIRFKKEDYEKIVQKDKFDLLIHKKNENIYLFSKEENIKIEQLTSNLSLKLPEKSVQLIEMSDVDEIEYI